jgi:integrase
MAVYATGKGYGVDWRDEFGRRHRKYVGTNQAAHRMDDQLRTSAKQMAATMKNYRAGEAVDLLTARDLYIAHAPLGQVSKAWQSERLGRLAKYVGNIAIAELTPKRLDEYAAARAQELSPQSLARELGLVKTLCAWLARNWYIAASPAEHLQTNLPKRSAGRCLTYAEESAVLACCTDRIRIKLMLAIDAGLRRGECNAVRANHINGSAGTITTFSTKTRTFRTIPLTPRLQVELNTLASGLAPDALLFAFGGREVKKGGDVLKRVRNKSRVNFRFHDLRHTFATRLAEVAGKGEIVRELLGHTIVRDLLGNSARSTTDLYLHLNEQKAADAIMDMAATTQAALRALPTNKEETPR